MSTFATQPWFVSVVTDGHVSPRMWATILCGPNGGVLAPGVAQKPCAATLIVPTHRSTLVEFGKEFASAL